jgi:4-amino-4-deoxy-L-arabinose transferase-like glycosyltransferase
MLGLRSFTQVYSALASVPNRARPPSSAIPLIGILILATLLRLYGLFDWPLEQDELYTVRDSVEFNISTVYKRPLYFFLQHLILQMFPLSVAALRLMPFVFGVAGVLATWHLAKNAFGTTAAWFSALLVAVAPWHIYTSQFARYWTLVYLLAAVTYLLLIQGLVDDRRRTYLLTLVTLILGSVTHPTFAFPVAGALIGTLLVSDQGRLSLTWPTRRAWEYLWGPVLALGAVGLVVLAAVGIDAVDFNLSREVEATRRVIPAIIEWLSPVIVTAGLLGTTYLATRSHPRDRRWGIMTALGGTVGLGVLLAISTLNSIYSIYFTAALPLLFATVGGLVQRAAESSSIRRPAVTTGCALVLIAAMLPGTVSHLSDGTRFDYRPVFDHIRRSEAAQRKVVSWPAAVHHHYASDLPYRASRLDSASLQRVLDEEGSFWLILRRRRYGIDAIGGVPTRQVLQWISNNCRNVQEFFRPRVDYREYRLQLYSCEQGMSAPKLDAISQPPE